MITVLRTGNHRFYIPDHPEDVAEILPALSLAREVHEVTGPNGRPEILISDQMLEIGIRGYGSDVPISIGINDPAEEGGVA